MTTKTRKLKTMINPSEATVCVVDHDKGLFLPVAQRLARDCERVLYYTPNDTSFPSLKGQVGDGIEAVVRIDDLWKCRDVSAYIFPDIGFSGLQQTLAAVGHPVMGSRDGDRLETNRGLFLHTLEKVGLPVPKYSVLVGMSRLREYLKDAEDVWIKVSRWRGDWETMHWRNWDQDEGLLDYKASVLGPWREQIRFYVFDSIQTHIEDGFDTFFAGGQFPDLTMHGMEAKDEGYLSTWCKCEDLPKQLQEVMENFGPVLTGYDYSNFFSSEVRITEDGTGYFIDPTCRAGSPPSQVQTEMIDNYSEVLLGCAFGELVEPVPAAMFGCQVQIKAKGDHRCWTEVEIPDELKQWVKCGNAVQIDGRLCIPPDHESPSPDIGWLVATGDTIKEAIESLHERIKLLPDGLCANPYALADLLGEVREAEDSGMEFTPQTVPEPSSVIADA